MSRRHATWILVLLGAIGLASCPSDSNAAAPTTEEPTPTEGQQ